MYVERPVKFRLKVWDLGVSSVTVNKNHGSERNCRRILRLRNVIVNFVPGSEVNTVFSGSLVLTLQITGTRRFELIVAGEIIRSPIM